MLLVYSRKLHIFQLMVHSIFTRSYVLFMRQVSMDLSDLITEEQSGERSQCLAMVFMTEHLVLNTSSDSGKLSIRVRRGLENETDIQRSYL